jgi:hypothetical protein
VICVFGRHKTTKTSQATLQSEEHKKMTKNTRRLNLLSGVASEARRRIGFSRRSDSSKIIQERGTEGDQAATIEQEVYLLPTGCDLQQGGHRVVFSYSKQVENAMVRR